VSFELLLIFILGFIASFIGTNVGGAGLITVPLLIFLGLPSQVAVATNKIGGLGLTSIGLITFHGGKKVNYRIGIPIAVFSMVGAYLGSNVALALSEELVKRIIGFSIIAVLLLVFSNKNLGVQKKEGSILAKVLGYISFIFIGFWSAFVGGGGAIISNIVLVSLFGLTFLESAGTRKIPHLVSNITASLVYIIHGTVYWIYAIPLLLGMAMGSHVGARWGLAKGDIWIRRLFMIVVVVSALKLLV